MVYLNVAYRQLDPNLVNVDDDRPGDSNAVAVCHREGKSEITGGIVDMLE
jgi:hypothetical protein